MKKLILIICAIVSFASYSAERVKIGKRPKPVAVDQDSARKLGVSRRALAEMNRRLQVLNATTNRPVESVIQTREAQAGFRTKLKAAEIDAAYTRKLAKAAKKSTKAREKIIKTIEQAKKKSSDEDEIAFYDSLKELINSK